MNNLSFEYRFALPNGLHARPATALMMMVKSLGCKVHLTNLRNNKIGNADSVLSMIACDIACNDNCLVTLEGDSCQESEKKLRNYLSGEFLTCDEALPEVQEGQRPLPYILQQQEMNYHRGVAVSGGIGRGEIIRLGEPVLQISCESVEQGTVAEESAKLERARQRLMTIMEKQAQRASAEEKAVNEAHLALLCDQELTDSLMQGVANGQSALGAILATRSHFEAMIAESTNQYLRERVLDIRDVCQRLIEETYGPDTFTQVDTTLTSNSICIADHLAPSQFLALDRNYLKGLVMAASGSTSHTVILARSFGIPVLTGVSEGDIIAVGTDCIIDAQNNILIVQPTEPVLRYYDLEQQKLERIAQRHQRYLTDKAQTTDGFSLEVAANIASAVEAETAFAQGAEGIGLFRTEMLYMDRGQAPSEEEQFTIYRDALKVADGRPVIIRTMDIGGDKPVDYFSIGDEENPFLGYRAIRLYPEYLAEFKAQLRAILRAAVYGNCKVMIPMVSSVAEARWVRETYNEVLVSLVEERVVHQRDVPLGMMLEVPSCAFIIDQLVRYMDFFSIGSNDLTQYFLATDRGNARVEKLYDSLNPAFLRQLKHIVDEVHKAGSWVGMCGEFAADPAHMPILIGLQLDEISLGAPRIPVVKEAISTLELSHCQAILAEAMTLETAEEVRVLLREKRQNAAIMLPILTKETICVDADCQSKAEVIKTLIDNLEVNGRLANSTGAEAAIWEREGISPTMLGFGIAIPHCKSDHIAANTISIMKLKQPVLWNEGDEVLTDTIFMLTVRASDADNTHMRIFAQLARRIVREEFRTSLAACTSVDELMSYISQELEL